MKNLLLFSLLILFLVPVGCDTEQETTYYLIRHAEKDRTNPENKNPDLTDAGQDRALRWANYFEEIDLDAVYSTDYNRTQQTAAPTAEMKALEVMSYDPRNLYSDEFQVATKNKSVLIVGHSNTTPAFVNAILGEDKYPDMDDNDNASLYQVTIKGDSQEVVISKVE